MKTKTPKSTQRAITFLAEKEMILRLDEEAKKNHRSRTGQILHYIQFGLAYDEGSDSSVED